MKRVIFCVLAAMPLLGMAAATDDASADHVKASLISEQSAFVPGTTAWIGLRLRHEPHWHTYWINPGDSGLADDARVDVADGFQGARHRMADADKRFDVGGLYNFGYDGEVVLPVASQRAGRCRGGNHGACRCRCEMARLPRRMHSGQGSLSLDLPIAPNRRNPTRPAGRCSSRTRDLAQPQATAWKGATRSTAIASSTSLAQPEPAEAQIARRFRRAAENSSTTSRRKLRTHRRSAIDRRLREKRVFRNDAGAHSISLVTQPAAAERARLARAGSVRRDRGSLKSRTNTMTLLRILPMACRRLAGGVSAAASASVGQPAPDFSLVDGNGADAVAIRLQGQDRRARMEQSGMSVREQALRRGNMQEQQADAAAQGVVWLTINSAAPGKQGHLDAAGASAYVANIARQGNSVPARRRRQSRPCSTTPRRRRTCTSSTRTACCATWAASIRSRARTRTILPKRRNTCSRRSARSKTEKQSAFRHRNLTAAR